MNPYNYANGEPSFNLHLKQKARSWLHYAIDFPSAHPTVYEKNNTVRGEYFEPRTDGKAPLAILIHGVGDRSVIPCKALARSLAKRGIACFVLYLVFHSSRMPEEIKSRFPKLTNDEWFDSYCISVTDVRQIIDWADTRAKINKEQIAVFGLSFGGIISAIAMGVDKRIKAGILLITGGNFEKIIRMSKTLGNRMGYSPTEAEFNARQDRYRQYLDQVAQKGFENVNIDLSTTDRGFLTDPMTFAYSLRKRPVLMINALWDEVFPRQTALDFWEACDKPAITWLPAGHATIWLWYPIISRKIIGFLRVTFGL